VENILWILRMAACGERLFYIFGRANKNSYSLFFKIMV